MALEETYENLNSAWLEKKKTLENLEIEIRVSLSPFYRARDSFYEKRIENYFARKIYVHSVAATLLAYL